LLCRCAGGASDEEDEEVFHDAGFVFSECIQSLILWETLRKK
jgi:hypothetical protein